MSFAPKLRLCRYPVFPFFLIDSDGLVCKHMLVCVWGVVQSRLSSAERTVVAQTSQATQSQVAVQELQATLAQRDQVRLSCRGCICSLPFSSRACGSGLRLFVLIVRGAGTGVLGPNAGHPSGTGARHSATGAPLPRPLALSSPVLRWSGDDFVVLVR